MILKIVNIIFIGLMFCMCIRNIIKNTRLGYKLSAYLEQRNRIEFDYEEKHFVAGKGFLEVSEIDGGLICRCIDIFKTKPTKKEVIQMYDFLMKLHEEEADYDRND